ncbi:helix-turn-helix transcriptional regulator [Aquiflexum sp.]|uniref:helix-turn-helix transcriptional regulator n=1 Tax=Aquiflexum sp. TaxID=1872584 RepID=UPI0035942A5F
MNRLDRLTAILTHLQSKRIIKAQELANRFDISQRTVYRDIRALEQAGVPVIGEAGMGYSLVDGYRLPPVMFTKEEAMSFVVAEKMLKKVADKDSSKNFSTAMFKIKSVLKNAEKDVLEKMDTQVEVIRKKNSLHSTGKDHVLQSILNSLAEKKVIKIQYTTFVEEKSSIRDIEPVGVYYAFEQWYVIGWCRLRADYRNFRLDRIREIKILDEVFVQQHPSLKEYLEKVEKEENLIKVVIEIHKSTNKYVREQRYNHGLVMEKEKGDMVELTFMTSSIEGFARWIIMIADYITIIQPQALKVRLKELLDGMLVNLEVSDQSQ